MRVYLAKSNKANPDFVARIRKYLKEFDIEVIEYSGGSYSNKPLLSCDMIIMVTSGDLTRSNSVIIGKGLYQQHRDFYANWKGSKGYNNVPIYIAREFSEVSKDLVVSMTESLNIQDSNNYVNHSKLILRNHNINISRILADKLISSIKSTKNINEELLLLTLI